VTEFVCFLAGFGLGVGATSAFVIRAALKDIKELSQLT
jgi:hypothetical protein